MSRRMAEEDIAKPAQFKKPLQVYDGLVFNLGDSPLLGEFQC